MTMRMCSGDDVAVIIPAKDEQERIAATVAAAKTISSLVIVVDDGSTDGTAGVARQAGAMVVAHTKNHGKAAAMKTGADAAADLDKRDSMAAPRHLLFLDADFEETAKAGAALVEPVRAGQADMAIAILPRQDRQGGGFGFVVRLARNGIRRLTGFTATQPLAHGWGVETGLTIDLVRKGFRITEVAVDIHHRVTGRDLHAQLHRARQYAHVAAALLIRQLRASFQRTPGKSGER